jgi:hypothetical protein
MTKPSDCHWRDLRVVRVDGGKVSKARVRAVLVYWQEHSEPPAGYTVVWPPGAHSVCMDGFEEGDK